MNHHQLPIPQCNISINNYLLMVQHLHPFWILNINQPRKCNFEVRTQHTHNRIGDRNQQFIAQQLNNNLIRYFLISIEKIQIVCARYTNRVAFSFLQQVQKRYRLFIMITRFLNPLSSGTYNYCVLLGIDPRANYCDLFVCVKCCWRTRDIIIWLSNEMFIVVWYWYVLNRST